MEETGSPVPQTPPVPTRKRSKKVRAPRVPRGPRTPHRLAIGRWSTNSETNTQQFVQESAQPVPDLTEVVDLVAWAQKNLYPGEYDVVRVLPGKLMVAKQETFKALFVETK